MTQEDYIKKYGEKDGMKRWRQKERSRRYYEANKEVVKERRRRYYTGHKEQESERCRQYREVNKEKVYEQQRQYREANKEQISEQRRRYREENRDKERERHRRYYEENRDKVKEQKRRYRKAKPMECRANQLVQNYRQEDHKYHRGECTLTVQWILDNIFSRSCLYCGEEDWHLLGCDRINNNKPHTPDNVVCCCGKCNKKRMHKDFLEFALSIGAVESEGLTI